MRMLKDIIKHRNCSYHLILYFDSNAFSRHSKLILIDYNMYKNYQQSLRENDLQ